MSRTILAQLRRTSGAAAVALLAACGSAAPDGPLRGMEVVPAKPKPSFTLTATDGRRFDFAAETRGQLTLLFFGFTSCPDVCPVHLANIAAVLRTLPPTEQSRIRVVFITTDPARDTPAKIRAWLDNFDRRFVGLHGSRHEVNAIEASIGIAPSSPTPSAPEDTAYLVGHAAQVLAYTADDSLRAMYPFGVRQQDWAADLPKLLRVGAPAERR